MTNAESRSATARPATLLLLLAGVLVLAACGGESPAKEPKHDEHTGHDHK